MLYFQSIQDHSWRRHHGAGVCAFGGEPEGKSADRTGTSDRGDRSCKACKHGGHDGSGQPCGKVTCAVR